MMQLRYILMHIVIPLIKVDYDFWVPYEFRNYVFVLLLLLVKIKNCNSF